MLRWWINGVEIKYFVEELDEFGESIEAEREKRREKKYIAGRREML